MDRTIIMPYRAEEKEQSHILYQAIQGLNLLYPATEELKKCLSDEMFIKPNQPAFFQVMAYLFRILDAQEFKKRFFWPITDKRSESNFRTSTVEYLKFLNEKHHLNWTNIKSYLVVMPGGMKFISFLLEFVHFIAQELIKQKEKQLNLDAAQQREYVSEANLHKLCRKNVVFKEMASNFLENIECCTKKYDEAYEELVKLLDTLSQGTGLSVDLLTDDKFLDDFEESNRLLFERQYSERTKKILAMEELIGEVKEAMDKFYSKETGYKYDKQTIFLQLRRIRDHFPLEELKEECFASKITDEGVNINTLITTFNSINNTIQNELEVVNKRPRTGEFVYSRVLSLKQNLHEMETQLTDCAKTLHAYAEKYKPTEYPHTPIRATMAGVPKKLLFDNTLLSKLVSTPTIKLEAPECGGKFRLALVDSKTTNTATNETTFNNFLAPPRSVRQTNRHHSIVDQSITDLNNTGHRSKIIDPMELLRSTSKKDSFKCKGTIPKINISNLGNKWKQQQSLFNDNEYDLPQTPATSISPPINTTTEILATELTSPKTHIKNKNLSKTSPQSFTKTATPTMINQSPYTPFGSNDRTRIARSQYQLMDTSHIGGGNKSPSTSLSFFKKLSAVKKVQDASMNFADLSTSPSGRLDPLFSAEELEIPRLKLNDVSLIDPNLSSNNSRILDNSKIELNASCTNEIYLEHDDENNAKTANIGITVDEEQLKEYVHAAYTKEFYLENDENNANTANICLTAAAAEEQLKENAIFDTSDSVLKDVTF